MSAIISISYLDDDSDVGPKRFFPSFRCTLTPGADHAARKDAGIFALVCAMFNTFQKTAGIDGLAAPLDDIKATLHRAFVFENPSIRWKELATFVYAVRQSHARALAIRSRAAADIDPRLALCFATKQLLLDATHRPVTFGISIEPHSFPWGSHSFPCCIDVDPLERDHPDLDGIAGVEDNPAPAPAPNKRFRSSDETTLQHKTNPTQSHPPRMSATIPFRPDMTMQQILAAVAEEPVVEKKPGYVFVRRAETTVLLIDEANTVTVLPGVGFQRPKASPPPAVRFTAVLTKSWASIFDASCSGYDPVLSCDWNVREVAGMLWHAWHDDVDDEIDHRIRQFLKLNNMTRFNPQSFEGEAITLFESLAEQAMKDCEASDGDFLVKVPYYSTANPLPLTEACSSADDDDDEDL